MYRCVLSFGGKDFEGVGFMDSGNRLVHKKSGLPIVLCSEKMRKKIISSGALLKAESDLISIRTVSGKKIITIYKTDKFLIYNRNQANKINNVMVGFITESFGDGGEYDLLLSPSVV